MIYGLFWIWSIFSKDSSEDEFAQKLEGIEEAIVLCRVEKIQDVFYLYNAQDDNFVGQARDVKGFVEVSERLQKHLMIVDGDEAVVDQLKNITNEISISK